MRKFHFLLSFIFLVAISAFSRTREDTVAAFKEKFKEVIVDVRGSRGGNGDVAAGYLTIMDFIQNYQITDGITVLVDSESRKILDRLAKGNSRFWSIAKVETIDSLPTDRVFDLYLALASPSGSFRYGKQLRERMGDEAQTDKIDDKGKKISIRTEGVLMVQTVLGNTENRSSVNPFAVARSNGVSFDMSPAGIASNESGIYNDYVAVQLRSMSAENVQDFVYDEAKLMEDLDSRARIINIVGESHLKGAKVGLAYGISAGKTKQQLMSYLKGLEAGKSFCLITPSKFDQSDIVDPELRQRVVVVNSEDKLPWNAEPGKIYIVKTKTLPHKVFVGLMAYSMKKGLVPVGAGDGFMSAAINLGGPFVLTRVAWNAKNIANLKQRLLAIAKKLYTVPAHIALVESLFDSVYGKINMNRAQALQPLAPLFARLSEEVPDLSERIMDAAVVVHEAAKSNPDPAEKAYLAKVPDETLRKSIETGGIAGAIKTTAELADILKNSFDSIFSGAGFSKAEILAKYKKYFDGPDAGMGAGSLKPFEFSFHDIEPLHHKKFASFDPDSNSETASVDVDPSKKAMAEIMNIYFPKNKDGKLPIESQLGTDWINEFEFKKIKPSKPLTLDEAFKFFKKTSEDVKKAELLDKIDNLVFYDPKSPSDKNYLKYDNAEYFKEFAKKFTDKLKNSSKNKCVEFYKM